jgi:hypothetical protein
MKKIAIFILIFMAFFSVESTHATPPDYFYVEIVCENSDDLECTLQNATPFTTLNSGNITFYQCDRISKNWSCDVDLITADGNGSVSGRLRWTNTSGSFTLEKGQGTLNGLHAVGDINKINESIYAFIGTYHVDPSKQLLTHLPCDPASVDWMQPHGQVDHGGSNSFFHDGIDFGTTNGGKFFSAGNGQVTVVELNTGKGWPGTNYRIIIKTADDMNLDYHFEIGGYASEDTRISNIFVSVGDKVKAGQHIANLIYGDDSNADDIAHVHWGIYNGHQKKCPLNYFTPLVANDLEALYDSGIEKRPAYRGNLCE